MCESCGCAAGGTEVVVGGHRVVPRSGDAAVLTHLLADNDATAAHNREHIEAHGVLAVNLMSSPGAGKTALLEATIEALHREFRFGVIEGDLETENDAARIRRHNVPAVQITTGTACHLDAEMVHAALHDTAAGPARHPVHRECRQPGLPGRLRAGPAPQRHAAVGDRGRRQAGEIPGDVPRLGPGADHQGGPAAAFGRFRSGAGGSGDPAPGQCRRRCSPCRRAGTRDGTLGRLAAGRTGGPAPRGWGWQPRHDLRGGMACADPRAGPPAAVPDHECLRRA